MTKFKDLKTGEKLSETQYYSVVKVSGDMVQLKPDSGDDIVVNKGYVESFLTSSVQYDSEEVKTRTEMAALFLASPGVVMTVNFNTQVKEKEAIEKLVEIYPNKGGKMTSEAEYKKKVGSIISEVVVGKERTMIGRHYGSQNEFGRVSFIDMEVTKDTSKADYDSRTRQVDPRTINWMIIRGVKYKTK